MNSPHFLIIGAQKCGTSWLHQQLRQHPDIFMPADKDAPHFFKDPVDFKSFLARFEQAPTDSIIGDANASYFWTRNAGPYPGVFNSDISAAITRKLGQQIKIIVLLRHPVERAISAYLHHIAHRSLGGNYGILEAPAELGILSLSRYRQHLQHWQEDIASEHLLVLPTPTRLNTRFILDRVFSFLNIRNTSPFPDSNAKVFEGLKRKRLDDGVWLPSRALEALGFETKARPYQEIDAETHIRVIDKAELSVLEDALDRDIHCFLRLSEKWLAPNTAG